MGNEETHALKRLWLYSIICQNKAPASAKEGNTPKKEKQQQQQKSQPNPPKIQKERKKKSQLQNKSAKLVAVLELTACLRSERRFQTLP